MSDEFPSLEAEFEAAKELYAQVGFMTILWARMEGTLDLINRLLFYHAGGSRFEDRFPLALDRKLTFLRRCHRDLPELVSIQEAGFQLIDLVHTLKEQRHDIIHGDAETMPVTKMELVVLKRAKQDKQAILGHQKYVDGDDLNHFIDQVLSLLELCSKHSHAVAEVVLADSDQNPG